MKIGKGMRFLLLIGLCLAAAAGHAKTVDRIVAVVNNDIITSAELEAVFEPIEKRIEQSYQGPDRQRLVSDGRLNILKRMIDSKLIEQQAAKQGLKVRDEEIDDTIRDLLSKRSVQMSDFLKTLESEGSSLEAYRQEIRGQMIRIRLLRKEIRATVLVSEEEIGDYYVKHRSDYEGEEAFRIKQILIRTPENMDRSLKLKRRQAAEEIRRRLREGESFDLLAMQFSEGPAAQTGGDIGFVEKGAMLHEVDEAAGRLAKDEISEVIASPVGFHIIKLLDKKGAGTKSIAAIRQEIKLKLEEEKMEKKYEQWIGDLRKKSHIEIKL